MQDDDDPSQFVLSAFITTRVAAKFVSAVQVVARNRAPVPTTEYQTVGPVEEAHAKDSAVALRVVPTTSVVVSTASSLGVGVKATGLLHKSLSGAAPVTDNQEEEVNQRSSRDDDNDNFIVEKNL